MFKLLSILALIVVRTYSDDSHTLNETSLLTSWNSFKFQLSKSYSPHEDDRHFSKFRSNYLRVAAHNKAFSEHKATYKTTLNELSALSYEDYLNNYLTKIPTSSLEPLETSNLPPPSLSLDKKGSVPDNFDWRSYGLVSPVKQQSTCGSCWAFAAYLIIFTITAKVNLNKAAKALEPGERAILPIEFDTQKNIFWTTAVETIYAYKFNTLRRFSEQELVDCDVNNWGCDGGYPTNSFFHAYKNGLVEENTYPYKAKKGVCIRNSNQTRYKIKGFAKIPVGDEETLKKVVATYGPVAVALDASDWGFGHYSTGIFSSTTCKTNLQNHAVVVVGYGTEENQDYWIVKNSWGRSWGLNGYIKMARNKNNMCGIATMGSYAYL